MQECIDIAGMAVERNPNNANAHKWFVLLTSRASCSIPQHAQQSINSAFFPFSG